MSDGVKVSVPASTSNLGAGFDTLGLALQLYLRVEMRPAPGQVRVKVRGEGQGETPTGAANLIFASAQKLFARFGEALSGAEIDVHNEIPLSRGLGSSGAATIAGLLAAARLLNKNVSRDEILSLAAEMEGHPENAAASLLGGLTVNCVAGTQVLSHKVAVDGSLTAVLLIPEKRVSTEEARRILPQSVPLAHAVFNVQRSALLVHAFHSGNVALLREAMEDRLHQPFRKHLIPGYDEFVQSGYQSAALGVCISGSGSTILGLVRNAHAGGLVEAWKATAQAHDVAARVLAVGLENRGALVEEV